jgi:hypothetical protein
VTRFGDAIRRAEEAESSLASEFTRVANQHEDEPDVFHLCRLLGEKAEVRAARLEELEKRDGDVPAETPLLLADLTALYMHVQEAWIHATIVRQAALAKRDRTVLAAADESLEHAAREAKWVTTRIKTTAPQALSVE